MNKKSIQARAQILHLLCEGNSLRSTSRLAGVSINTVTKLLVEAGEACASYQNRVLRGLTPKRIQIDEIWSFVYSKAKNVPEDKRGQFGFGDVWTFTAIDADTKLIPAFMVGNRDSCNARMFLDDLRSRITNRVQLTTDGHKMYLDAVEHAFGADADFAQLQKHYAMISGKSPETRYSPGQCCGITKEKIEGNPDPAHISTSFVERANLTIRMGNRRFTRLTNAFSKKVENHVHSLALQFMHYNFACIHKTLRVTPAMEAGITDHAWEIEEIVALIDTEPKVEIIPVSGLRTDKKSN
ncbi:IS1 family transposase [Candidatus Sumerlaeota bacterium]|nr:IS1 family transposase [Candidatus Sumerlaeota bacterium]